MSYKQINLKLEADLYNEYKAVCKDAGDDLKQTLVDFIETRIKKANSNNIGFHFKRKNK